MGAAFSRRSLKMWRSPQLRQYRRISGLGLVTLKRTPRHPEVYCTARSVKPFRKSLSQRPFPPAAWVSEESATPAGPDCGGK
jgi:hypothetical protein